MIICAFTTILLRSVDAIFAPSNKSVRTSSSAVLAALFLPPLSSGSNYDTMRLKGFIRGYDVRE